MGDEINCRMVAAGFSVRENGMLWEGDWSRYISGPRWAIILELLQGLKAAAATQLHRGPAGENRFTRQREDGGEIQCWAEDKGEDCIYIFYPVYHYQTEQKKYSFHFEFFEKILSIIKEHMLMRGHWKINFNRHLIAEVVWRLCFSSKFDWKLVEISPRFWYWTDCQSQLSVWVLMCSGSFQI